MKKVFLFFGIVLICIIMLVLLNKNGFRGGDVFQKNTIEAININLGSNVNFKPLFEEHKCDDKIYIQVFEDEDSKLIHCATFEKKGAEYAYLYGFNFELNGINDKTGLEFYDVYNGCDVIYGIMPGTQKGIIINESIITTDISFEIEDKTFYCWYASVEGGYDAVRSISYIQ